MSSRKAALRAALSQTRAATLRLLDRVPDAFLKRRVHDFYSPVGWHFGHIGMTEEYWVCTRALGHSCLSEELSFLFANIPDNPKDNRVYLPERTEIVAYLAETRERTLAALEAADLDTDDPLIADGYAWEFALEHECQHQETIAELLQLIQQASYRAGSAKSGAEWPVDVAPTETVAVPGGTFCRGNDRYHGYDNEKDAHTVTVAPFALDRTPVTAGQWHLFLRDGGYRRRELWIPEGWAWRESENVEHPEYWLPVTDGYLRCGADGPRPIHPEEPASSIGWYEADAYARWAGKRLPTEAEWEYAAACDPATGGSHRFPWGEGQSDDETITALACCGRPVDGPLPVGSRPRGVSALGLLDMAGGVWEWTASPFLPYPGFVAFPYDGYSKDHMEGRHFVCRGGSWATAPRLLRCSFRNWYVPTYRQGFLGLRCAQGAVSA